MSADGFAQKVGKVIANGFTSAGISMGTRLGLFDALAKLSQSRDTAVTSSQLANSLDYKERYVREWINAMACADILDHVEVNGEDRYWIAPYRVPALIKSSSGWTAQSAEMLTGAVDRCRSVEQCFPNSGPSGTDVDDYPGLHEFLARRQSAWKLTPNVEGLVGSEELVERLESGIAVLEMGCGAADPTKALAKRFPNSKFVASELTESNLKRAKDNCKDMPNVEFAVVDACNVPEELSEKFDFIMLFDVFHDVPYPQKLLEGVWKLLRTDGQFMMNEINMYDSVKQNVASAGDSGTVMYMISTLYCMPTSVRHPGGAGLGACAGPKVFERMLRESRLANIEKREDDVLGLTFIATKISNLDDNLIEAKKRKI